VGARAGGAGARRSRPVPRLLPPRLRVHRLPPAGAETREWQAARLGHDEQPRPDCFLVTPTPAMSDSVHM
jgi:hypothetical protein